MRFRLLTMSDIPEIVKLYEQLQAEQRPEELPYPLHSDQAVNEFTGTIAHQLALNTQGWFGIAGVVGSTIKADDAGGKYVVGGKTKALITLSLSQRTIGAPKNIAFIEMIVVDPKLRKRDVGRKLVQLAAVEAAKRGAQVLEGSWNPNSLGSEMWPQYGLRPYRVLGAYVDEKGEPRSDLPMPKVKHENPA